MRKLIDVSSFKKEEHGKFNFLHPAGKEARIREFFRNHRNKILKTLAVLLVLAFLWKLSAVASSKWPFFSDIDSDKFQAVFLTNGQAYFGHISEIGESSLVLEDIYYFKASGEAVSGQQLNLVRLEDEIYGPEDVIHISNSQVSYWQNLRSDSQVVKMINQLEGRNNN